MTGLPELKERIAGKIATLYGTRYDVDREVLITASASQGSTRLSADWCIRAMRLFTSNPLSIAMRRLSVCRGDAGGHQADGA
jgi:hypothetical protein